MDSILLLLSANEAKNWTDRETFKAAVENRSTPSIGFRIVSLDGVDFDKPP